MHLTPDLLRSAYALLRETAPFDKWALPEAEDVEFRVLRTCRWYGDCQRRGEQWIIRLSESKHPRLLGMLSTMAHELIHVHLREVACHRDSHHHGPAFRGYAEQVLAAHPEFDPVTF